MSYSKFSACSVPLPGSAPSPAAVSWAEFSLTSVIGTTVVSPVSPVPGLDRPRRHSARLHRPPTAPLSGPSAPSTSSSPSLASSSIVTVRRPGTRSPAPSSPGAWPFSPPAPRPAHDQHSLLVPVQLFHQRSANGPLVPQPRQLQLRSQGRQGEGGRGGTTCERKGLRVLSTSLVAVG